jgi:hypothetical protein
MDRATTLLVGGAWSGRLFVLASLFACALAPMVLFRDASWPARVFAGIAGAQTGRVGTWTPIVTSKRVVSPGHKLRAFHERTIELTLVPKDNAVPLAWWDIRWLRNDLVRILRAEDQLRIDSGSIRLRLHADAQALHPIIARLEGELSGWKALASPAAPPVPSIVEASA